MTQNNDRQSIVLDLRCMQDPNYAGRGIGRHTMTLLRRAPKAWHIAGLIDPAMNPLPPEAREALGAVHLNAYAASRAGTPRQPPTGFVTLSPMTHDPMFAARLLSDPTVPRAAVVYDFIPRRAPERYLASPSRRLNYALALRWLARCDLFLPISRHAADDLTSILGVPESAIAVTGCAFDPAFESVPARWGGLPGRHLLVVGGGDPRKNPDVVIRAHAGSAALQRGSGIPLVIAGNYGPSDAMAFRAIARAAGGRADLIEVPGHLPDPALLELYGRALAIVCPSRDEGFDIPVVEGMAAGLPCLASDIPVHAELVTDPACLFPADDDSALRPKLEQAVADAAWRAATLARQAGVWPRFSADAVAARFWDGIRARLGRRAPAVSRGVRPRVALLSPLPPDRSGVADYTAATCAALGQLVELHVFTETAAPAPLPGVTSVRPLSALPSLDPGFDRVIGVIGNSHFHTRIFDILRRHGGACIAHDARMLGFYRILLGRDRALEVASRELGRAVTDWDLNGWLADESTLEALFLGEIAESAAPAIVHSPVTARLFQERYGIAPVYLPFSVYRPWLPEELTRERRTAARARLGVEPGEIVIATFGHVHHSKAPEECVWALELLRGWGIAASMHFAGGFTDEKIDAPGLRPLVAELRLERHVRFASGYVSEQTYRDYLLGADLGVQLRTYGLGGLSGGLLDCAAAGLPTVTNEALGAAVGVPDYVRCIPDAISPLLLAEALAELLDAGLAAERPEAARQAWSGQRSFAAYARGLCQALSLDAASHAAARPGVVAN
jgi:glycosyltransferase involved in cell wall biosynthesis